MTDEEKVYALTELLDCVIYSLGMKHFEIEDVTESHKCKVEAQTYYQQMCDILYREGRS